MVKDDIFKGLETLLDEVLFIVLSGHGEDIQNNFPTRSNEFALLVAKRSDAHNDVLLDFFFALIH